MKVLAIGAHFDDLELGCGGSLLRWSAEGHQVAGLILTDSGYRDENGREIRSASDAKTEGREAAQRAGYKLIEGPFKTFGLTSGDELNSFLLSVLRTENPDLVLTHWLHDTHTDHRLIAQATLHCVRRIPRVLMYRSNWYLGAQSFHPNFFVDTTSVHQKKLDLIRIYKSEVARAGGKWLDWVEHQAKELGLVAGVESAEGFEVIRWTW